MLNLFESFIREKQFLKNVSQLTIRSYRQAFDRFCKHSQTIDKASLNAFVIGMREAGLSPTTCNISIRSFNSFLTWMFENGHTPERYRVPQLKAGKKGIRGYDDAELSRILSFKPKTFAQLRLYTLVCTLMDTGCRIDELLTLTRNNIDFDNLLITVTGKGNKERIIPISIELKKRLLKLLGRHNFDLVFGSSGHKADYRSLLKQWERLCKKLKIEYRGFHSLRHNFALNFIREQGDVFTLRRLLGHTSIQTTQIYVNLQTADLQRAHAKTSILSRLR
jgi:integrase/recombinase XerD